MRALAKDSSEPDLDSLHITLGQAACIDYGLTNKVITKRTDFINNEHQGNKTC